MVVVEVIINNDIDFDKVFSISHNNIIILNKYIIDKTELIVKGAINTNPIITAALFIIYYWIYNYYT